MTAPDAGLTKLQRLAQESAPDLLAAIEAEQARLRDLLAGRDDTALAQRPPNGNWSVLENVQHLLFTEQGHLMDFVPDRPAWSPFAMRPASARMRQKLKMDEGTDPPGIEPLLDEWQRVRRSMLPFLEGDSPGLRRALGVNLRHLRGHIAIIEKILRAHAREAARATRSDAATT